MATIEPLPGLVLATLRAMGVAGHPVLVVAVSGGQDSRVLLHAAAAAWPAGSLVLGHVHHGLQAGADDWQAFCERLARDAGLRFEWRRLPPRDEAGVENWARRHRYRALADIAASVGAGQVLTAHHGNDQLETTQMRRLRGAGALGLGGMRIVAPLPGHPELRLVRPFLGVGRGTLEAYARLHSLDWVDDPSNRDPKHLRNRVRASLDAAIARDASTLERGLAAVDTMQRDADARRRVAEADLDAARLQLFIAPDGAAAGGLDLARAGRVAGRSPNAEDPLSRAALARLPADRADEVLRAWLSTVGCRMPSRAKLAEIRRQLIDAEATQGQVLHDGRWLLRYRDRIVARAGMPADVTPTWFRWQGEARLTIGGLHLGFRRVAGGGRDPQSYVGHATPGGFGHATPGEPHDLVGLAIGELLDRDLLLDRGVRTDRLRLAPNGPRRGWRNLVQERGIPRWLRAALPVIRNAERRVLFVAPFGVDRSAGDAGPDRVEITWEAPVDLAAWI